MNLLKNKGSNVLVISDLHCPFEIDGSIDFLNDVRKEFKCDKVVCIGDEADFAGISFFDQNPDALSPGDELEELRKHLKPFFKLFPNVMSCWSNHTSRPYRVAFKAGLPRNMVKGYQEILGAPQGWQWDYRWEIDGVQYIHGEGFSGKYASLTAAERHRQSTVIGHTHTYAGALQSATERDLIFGLNVGCLLDKAAIAFQYGRNFPAKPVIGCGVVLDGRYPFFIPMDLGSRIKNVRNPKVSTVDHKTIVKRNGQATHPVELNLITKAELKLMLDHYNIRYKVKERKSNLIKMVVEAQKRLNDESKAGKKSWLKRWK